MRYVWVIAAAALSACQGEDEPVEALVAVSTGNFQFVPGSDWMGDETVKIETGSHDVLCEVERDLGGIGVALEDCEGCDVALDVVGIDVRPEDCPLAPETEPQVWIPARWVSFVPESRIYGVASGTLRVSDDGITWEEWSDATFGHGIIHYIREVPLTIEKPEDFEPRDEQPATVP
jgi:hypothetical protein